MYKVPDPTKPLQKGDTVCVVAPGMASDPNNLLKIKHFLNAWGLNAHIPKDIFKKGFISSNSVSKRLEFMEQALLAEESKMVWCIRGGYGAHELLPALQKIKKPKEKKIFCGFSDASSLHSFLIQNWGWTTLHGPHLDRLIQDDFVKSQREQIKKIIFGDLPSVTYKQLKPLNVKAEKLSELHSTIVGGNLITLQSHVGTPWALEANNKILFFEDIGERAYRISRVLTQFQQLKMFNSCRAIVFGEFTGGLEPDGKNLIPKVLKDFAEAQNVPVFHKLPCGHGANQWTLPLGTETQIYRVKDKFICDISTGIAEV